MPGTLLGTAAYMSPEQARGKRVDKRSDIWSFGCVLFECLTGQRLFQGETATDTVGAMLHKEPDWLLLPENTPLTVRWLLQKCLTKDRKPRLHDIADARVDLELAITEPDRVAGGLVEGSLPGLARQASGNRRGVVGLVCSVGLIAALLAWFLKPSPELDRHRSRHLGVYLGAEQDLYNGRHQALRISRDGSMVAYIVQGSDGADSINQVFLRKLDQLDSVHLEAADGATQLAFSPDGQSIAFQVGTTIKRISIDDGAAVPLFEAQLDLVLEWTQDHGILFLDGWGTA